MSRPDREARETRLRAAARKKSAEAVARAHRAIVSLENRGQTVNFNTVAEVGSVSKDFLYNNTELRALITQKRGRPAGLAIPATEGTEASAAVKLQVVTAALERLRAENAHLRQENARLRGEILSSSGRADRN